MARIVTVAAAQLGPIQREDSRASCVERMISLLQQAAQSGCDLVVFPELALTTFFPRWFVSDIREADHWYETSMPNAATQPLFDEAKRLKVGFSLGYAELTASGQRFNTQILVEKDGSVVAKYRKVHIPGHEEHEPDRPFQHAERYYFTPSLMKETEKNLALRVEETDSADSFLVYGRGILHLGVLVETMRREGYELTVGNPQVLIKDIDGKKHEPFEILVVDVPSEFSGKAIDLVTQKKGEMLVMESKGDMQHLEFDIPSRGLIGLRSQMLTQTAGEAVMAHRFNEYKPWKGPIPGRNNGVLIAKFGGTTTAYSIDKLQDRGRFFIEPGDEVYVGQILAEHIKPGDLNINAVEMKKLTNHRASGSDDSVRITPKTQFTLEECMEYIQQDECIEVTPKSVRMRKTHLDENDRKNASRSNG